MPYTADTPYVASPESHRRLRQIAAMSDDSRRTMLAYLAGATRDQKVWNDATAFVRSLGLDEQRTPDARQLS